MEFLIYEHYHPKWSRNFNINFLNKYIYNSNIKNLEDVYLQIQFNKKHNIHDIYADETNIINLSPNKTIDTFTTIKLVLNHYFADASLISLLNINEIINILNTIKISIPQDKINFLKYLSIKTTENNILSTPYQESHLFKYFDKCTIYISITDNIKPKKEFNTNFIKTLLNKILSHDDTRFHYPMTTDQSSYIFSLNNDIVIYEHNLYNLLTDITNFLNNTLLDTTYEYQTIEHDNTNLDATFVTKKYIKTHKYIPLFGKFPGVWKEPIETYLLPQLDTLEILLYVQKIFGKQLYKALSTDTFNITYPYGHYLHDILRFYYGFDATETELILKLYLITMHISYYKLNELIILSSIFKSITNNEIQNQWIVERNNIENALKNHLTEKTLSHFIYDGTLIDLTLSYKYTIEDIYKIINNAHIINLLFIIESGNKDFINMNPLFPYKDKNNITRGGITQNPFKIQLGLIF